MRHALAAMLTAPSPAANDDLLALADDTVGKADADKTNDNDITDLIAQGDASAAEASKLRDAEDARRFAENAPVLAYRKQLLRYGYFPLPVSSPGMECDDPGKNPNFRGWQHLPFKAGEKQHEAWMRRFPNSTNTGILPGPDVVLIDIDIDDEGRAVDAHDRILAITGPTWTKVRRNSKRVTLAFRRESGMAKVKTLTGTLTNGDKPAGIEFRTGGEQVVVAGMHHTGVPIEWQLGGEPVDGLPPVDDLPVLTQEHVDAIIKECAPLLGADAKKAMRSARAYAKSAAAEAPTPESLKAIDRRALAEIVLKIPNNGNLDARGPWIGFLHGLFGAFPDDRRLVEAIWRRLNAKWCWPNGKPRTHAMHRGPDGTESNEPEPEYVLRTITGPHNVGADYLIAIARRAGIDTTAYDVLAFGAAEKAVAHETALVSRAAALPSGSTAGPAPAAPADDDDADDPEAVRDQAINAVLDAGVTFWRDADHAAYASVPHAGTVQRYRIRSGAFGRVVRRLYGAANPVRTTHGSRPGSLADAAMKDVLPALETIAAHSDDVREPAVRVHGADDGSIWVDLGTDTWSAVKVTGDGWSIVTHADLPLIRPEGVRPLPIPQRDPNALVKLRGLLNLHGTDHGGAFKLIVAWLVAALYPRGPYCVLALDGEQGSGKTTAATMLRRLIDPNRADLRATPRTEDELIIAAMNSRVVAFDNVSHIDPAMADALCRIATGAGFGKRKLYSDGDEVLVNVCRPALLNGIPNLLSRGDLADRALAVTLPVIPDDQRRPEAEVWADFDTAHPGILALLLDALALVLRRLPDLKLSKLPRMADFARIACAAAPAFGWKEADEDDKGGMLDAIWQNRDSVVATVLESDPLATAVQAFAVEAAKTEPKAVADRALLGADEIGTSVDGGWSGTATELLGLLGNYVGQDERRARTWPKDATRLSTRLRRIAPALRKNGVEVTTQDREGGSGKRLIVVRQTEKAAGK